MSQETRKFTYPLLRYAFRKNLSSTDFTDIAHKICFLLKEECNAIKEIRVYFIYNSDISFELYFVIHSPAYPPDTHMVLPLVDNPIMEATFLREEEQRFPNFLNKYYCLIILY